MTQEQRSQVLSQIPPDEEIVREYRAYEGDYRFITIRNGSFGWADRHYTVRYGLTKHDAGIPYLVEM
jgi:hypothetical protein